MNKTWQNQLAETKFDMLFDKKKNIA